MNEIGDPSAALGERLDHVDIIQFSARESIGISEKIIEEYKKGQSVSDIARLMGRSKAFVLNRLKRAKIERRPKLARGVAPSRTMSGKQAALPYYGFCYLEGVITKDPREFGTLMIIHQRWEDGRSIHEIVKELNRKNIPSRKGRSWSWAAVQNIVKRFESGNLKIKKGGRYEF